MIDKAPDAYRTISEVAEDLGLPQHVLRFWETRFSQIRPLKRGGGRRYYRPDDVELLKGIRHLLYAEGYTIKGVQRILKEQGPKAVQAFAGDDAASQAHVALPAGEAGEDEIYDEVYEGEDDDAAPLPLAQPPMAHAKPLPPVAAVSAPAKSPAAPDLFAAAAQPAPVPTFTPPPAAAAMTRGPTVSFTRGGLTRAQNPVSTQSPAVTSDMPEAAAPILPIRRRLVASVEEAETRSTSASQAAEAPLFPSVPDAGLSDSSRRALQAALVELTECRRAIDRITATGVRSANP